MYSFHNLVVAGYVLYLVRPTIIISFEHCWLIWPLLSMIQDISVASAWVVSAANQYAKDHAKSPYVVYQGQWNILELFLRARHHPLWLANYIG